MWFLYSDTTDRYFYLCGNSTEFIVGRGSVNIQLAKDSSISREHAILSLKQSETGTKIILIDKGSKYGTYVDTGIESDKRINPQQEVILEPNARIRFGILANVWTLVRKKFSTVASAFVNSDKKKIKEIMTFVDGDYEEMFSSSCTHLTVPFLSLTLKLVQALVAGVPIVTLNYWENVVSCVKSNKELPKEEFFLPEEAEPLIKCQNKILLPKPERKQTFAGKTFVFLSTRQHGQFEQIINEAQGKTVLLAKSKLTKAKLCEKGIIIVQYIRSINSQSSQSTQKIDEIERVLQNKNLRLIPESEIGLAILFCSTEIYCNPSHDFKTNLVRPSLPIAEPSTVLVQETEPNCHVRETSKDINCSSSEFITPVQNNLDISSTSSDNSKTNASKMSSISTDLGTNPVRGGNILTHKNPNTISSMSGIEPISTASPKQNRHLDNSVITYNTTRKRNIDCAEVCNDSDPDSESDTPATKQLRSNDDIDNLFCFENEDDVSSGPKRKKFKQSTDKPFNKDKTVKKACSMTPNLDKQNTKCTPVLNKTVENYRQTEVSANNVPNESRDVTYNLDGWLSCNGNSIQMNISVKKNVTDMQDMPSEYHEWITSICEGINIECKKLCKKTTIHYNKSVQKNPQSINYKHFKKVQPTYYT